MDSNSHGSWGPNPTSPLRQRWAAHLPILIQGFSRELLRILCFLAKRGGWECLWPLPAVTLGIDL